MIQSHWRVILLVSLVTFVAYLVPTDVSVAQERMVPAIGLSIMAMGTITAWGFQLTYALFQVPAGLFGERFGTRSALAIIIATASLGAAAAPLIMAPVMERFGWRAVFLLSGIIALLTCIVWVMSMPAHEPAVSRTI